MAHRRSIGTVIFVSSPTATARRITTPSTARLDAVLRGHPRCGSTPTSMSAPRCGPRSGRDSPDDVPVAGSATVPEFCIDGNAVRMASFMIVTFTPTLSASNALDRASGVTQSGLAGRVRTRRPVTIDQLAATVSHQCRADDQNH